MEKILYNISNSPPTQVTTTNADGTISHVTAHVTTITPRPWAIPTVIILAAVAFLYILSLTRRNSRN